MDSYLPVNRFLEDLESRVLNILGYIPIVSTIFGPFRFFLGKLQFLGGLIFGIIKIIIGIFSCKAIEKRAHFAEAGFLFSYIVHGLLNMVRGMIETIPFFGLIFCLPYDRLFLFRFPYVTRAHRR